MLPGLLLWNLAARAAPLALLEREVWLEDRDDQALAAALGLSFAEGRDGGWARMVGDEAAIVALGRSGLRWRAVVAEDSGDWPTPAQNDDRLALLAATHPSLARLVTLGRSASGRPILGLRLSAVASPAAVWRVLGAHHGDEPVSAAVALALAEALLDGYPTDPAIARLLDEDAVWVVPQVNPDGLADGARLNARNVDINRNYNYEWNSAESFGGEAAFSEPESQAMRALAAWEPFTAGLSLHAGAANIGWVWNYSEAPTADAALLAAMADDYADATGLGGFWTTNGAAWYITYGDCNDWSYGRHGTLDFTVELSTAKSPPADALPGLVAAHVAAALSLLGWPDRVSGQLLDAETGRGVPGQVTLVEGGATLNTGPDGRFTRLTEGGPWTLLASAPGYAPAVISTDEADDSPLQIALAPASRQALLPEPRVLSRGGPGAFRLPVAARAVALSRPDEAPVQASPDGEGWRVSVADLAPGLWDLDIDGLISPRALFVGEVDDAARVEDVNLTDGLLSITGQGFATGSRAFALWGEDRAPVALSLLAEDTDTLLLDATPLPDAPVDLLVLSGGRQLAAAGVGGELARDTAAPPDTGLLARGGDTGPAAGGGGTLRAGRGCAQVPYPAAPVLVTLALALSLTRRRTA